MAILYYSQQDEFDLVNTGQDCMGWSVVDQAGTPIGTVTEMLIEPDAEMVDSILVDRKKRIPAGDIALRDGRVVVRGIMQDGELEMTENTATAATAATTTTTDTENQNYTAMQR
ncbi:MAG: PRC-barrel domain-containing protein, partial [Acidobacteriota bacterium]|nr:PRC-barrel domain-containing protein [Acidobacteriota bacterium]